MIPRIKQLNAMPDYRLRAIFDGADFEFTVQNVRQIVIANALQYAVWFGILEEEAELMTFTWDEGKEAINIAKHGISFSLAALVFSDDNRIEMFDTKHSMQEERYITIGSINGMIAVLFVVYTERNQHIRIISARKANSKERAVYLHGC